jgi:hypothetical protein
MKTVEVDALPDQVAQLLANAPDRRVLLTKGGKPYAIVSDATYLDEEDVGYLSDPAFWKLIAERRQRRGGVDLDEAYRRLEAREASEQAGS